jgi:chromosome partitioning protein
MKVIALYNMKGGVGKTTTAVNLSYLAASTGQRTLLWDLDPQGASSFAFRIRPRVDGFGRKSLQNGEALAAAIKETDYADLDLLPADFAYRKLDRMLGHLGKPKRVVTDLLETLGGNYDVVFLDCPAGFSLLTEGIFAAADALLVPTIPTVLSLRTLAQLIRSADRCDSTSELAAFFSMVDRRKALHRRAITHDDIFLSAQVPYASIVERMAIKRMPLPVFASRDTATAAVGRIWTELQTRLRHRGDGRGRPRGRWLLQLRAVESLIARLESSEERDGDISTPAPATVDVRTAQTTRSGESRSSEIHFVHRFDTDAQDLQRCGYVLELHERTGKFAVVAARLDQAVGPNDATGAVEARIDGWWAMQVLSGSMSPLAVLERRLSQPHSPLLESVRTIVGTGRLMRLNSRSGGAAPGHDLQRSSTPAPIVQSSPKPEVDRQTLDRSPLRRAIGD